MPDTTTDNRPIGWEGDALTTAFMECGVKFHHSNSEILEAFRNNGEREVVFDETGKPFAKYDAEILPLADALVRWGCDSPDGTCDRRTLPKSPGGGRRGIASKSDLPDWKAKSDFIKQFGGAAFEALPTSAPASEELKYRDQYFKLPTSEKVRLSKQYGSDFVATLPVRPTGTPRGSYINRPALEKIAKVRGRSVK